MLITNHLLSRLVPALCLVPVLLFAQSEGILTVKTEPEGIEVWLNDKYIGDSPIYDKRIIPGQYTVKLVDPIRRTSILEQIFIQAGETTVLEKMMTSKFGTLRVTTQPEGATVYLSTPAGKTPLVNEFMNPGKYRLEIVHPNKMYTPVVEEVAIARGESAALTKTLEKRKILDNKALVRLALGAGAAAGFIWAVVEQGVYKENEAFFGQPALNMSAEQVKEKKDAADAAKVKRVLGIVGGSLCVIGFEIVAFF